ncbi:unnamed protein product [Amoebophrya sp. A120]|nr:unnamed protein product [Amoebophrya sp. A120]|eukprot:GSA120T00003312001.1
MPPRKGGRKRKLADDDSEEQSRARQPKQVKAEIQPAEEAVPPFAEELPAAGGEAENDPAAVQETLAVELQPDEVNEEPDAFAANEQEIAAPAAQPQESAESSSSSSSSSSAAAQEEAQHAPAADEEAVPADAEVDVMEQQVDPPAEPPVSSNAKQVASASKKSSNSSSSSSSSKAANKKKDPPSASSKKNQPLSAGKVVNSASKAVSFKKPAKKDTIETLLPPLEEDEEKPEPKSAMKGNKAKTPMKVQFSQAEVEEFSASQLNGTPRLDPVTGLPLNSSAPTSSQQLPVPGASAAASSSSQHHTAAYYNSGSASAPPASSMFMNNSAASEQDQEEYQQGPPPPSGTGSNEGSVRPSAVPGAAPSAQNNTSSNPSSAASPDLPDNNVVQVEKEPEKKQRLMIEKIELENFKSYGEKRTIGPFHQLFSAVIGPNGSGKSNTIDALQFAFGKRAKEVRQNKLSELIHNSKGKENLKMCRVSVYMMDILDEPDFDADKPYTVVPNTEIVLTREATSKNVSTYYLNGKTSSFTEVTDKLKERGVDLVHNRFLILQGEVEAISLMKPKAVKEGGEDGFLEYLEDIIGSNKYVPAIQQGNRDLELITGTRTDKLRMYQMSEKAREQIKPQYKEALKWIETKKHLLISEAYRKQLERKSCRETVTEVQKCHDDAEKLVQENQKKKDEIVEKHKKLTDEHQDLLKVYRAKMDELKGCQEKMAQFEMDDKQCQQEKLETEQKKKQLDEEIREAQKEQADQAKNAEEQEKKVIPQAEQELKSTERFLEVQEDKLKKFENSLSGESSRLREEKMQWEAKQAPLANKKQELRGKLEMLEFERSQLTKHVQEAHARLDRMNMEHGQAIGQRKKLQEEIDFCSEQIHVKTPLVREGQKRLDELAEIIKSKTPILSHLNRQYEEAKYQVEAHRNTSKLMKGLYEARRKGDVDFIDRLGNLGKIDDKYDVAITQAGGGKHAFDQIVTETASQGTAIIKWLSENNAGRARVIALDQVSKEGWDRNPGNLPRPRIFDMVRATEDRLRPAFYLLLKNTLVVETMDEATQVSRHNGRHRVVTLDGGIVDPSGTVTGGGMQKAEGGGLSGPEASGPAYSEAEVEKMKKERDEAREYVAGVEKELVELTPVVQEVSNELEQKTRTKKHYEARVPDLDRNIEHYANRIEEAKTMPVLNPEQEKAVSKLQTEVSKVTSEIGNVDLELTEATDKVSELTNAIFNVGGEELKNLQNEVNNVKKKVEQLRKGHIKAKGQVEIFRKNVQEAVKKEAESRKKQENAEQALVDLEKLVEKTEKEAGECLERFHLLMTETQADEHQRKDLDAQLAKIDEDQNAVAMVLLDVQEQLSRTKEKLQAATASLEDTNRKLELFRKEYKDLPD